MAKGLRQAREHAVNGADFQAIKIIGEALENVRWMKRVGKRRIDFADRRVQFSSLVFIKRGLRKARENAIANFAGRGARECGGQNGGWIKCGVRRFTA